MVPRNSIRTMLGWSTSAYPRPDRQGLGMTDTHLLHACLGYFYLTTDHASRAGGRGVIIHTRMAEVY